MADRHTHDQPPHGQPPRKKTRLDSQSDGLSKELFKEPGQLDDCDDDNDRVMTSFDFDDWKSEVYRFSLLYIIRILENTCQAVALGKNQDGDAAKDMQAIFDGLKKFPKMVVFDYLLCTNISKAEKDDLLLLLANTMMISWNPDDMEELMKSIRTQNGGALFAEHLEWDAEAKARVDNYLNKNN